jgi:secondary thiamine-phosphate synthase enzyme
MKVFTSAIRIKTTQKTEEVNITPQVEATLLESAIHEGIALVFTGHTTASIHLNNADKDLEQDLQSFLKGLVPNSPSFKHNKGDFGRNADAHIKSLLIGNGITLPVTKGRIALGQWQAVYFSEFDGPRSRLISVKIMGATDAKAR